MGPVTITGPNEALRPLKDRLATMSDVRAAAAVLGWDQQTYMPPGGVAGHAEQLAALGRLAHEMLLSEETGALLDAAGESEPRLGRRCPPAARSPRLRAGHGRPPDAAPDLSYLKAKFGDLYGL
jgi:hypothetical protein